MAACRIPVLLVIKSWTFWYIEHLPMSLYKKVIHFKKMVQFFLAHPVQWSAGVTVQINFHLCLSILQSTANDCHRLPIVITHMIAQLFCYPTMANAWNYLKCEPKLRQWTPALTLMRLPEQVWPRERAGREGQSAAPRWGISPRVIIPITATHITVRTPVIGKS